MKIAQIAPPWITIPPKNYGGTEIVLYNLIEEQVSQGHDVTLFAPGDAETSAKLVSFFPRSLIDSGVPWHGHLKAYYHYHKAVEYIKSHQFDVVHTHLSSSADMYVYPLLESVSTPTIVTLHSRFPFDRVGSWLGDADQYYLDWLSSVPTIAISESARADVPYKLNFLGVIHHGLPTETFSPTVEQPEDFLFWLGRFVPEKGAHLAIEAAKACGRPLILAGTFDKHVPESVDYFDQVIMPQIDDQQIRYVGPVGMQQKIDLFSRAYGMLNPITWKEPFGMVIIEAMAVGCPVISYAQGSTPELVSHGKSGFLVDNMNEMLHYIDKIESLDRKEVRAHVEQNFSARVMTAKYTNAYRQTIKSFSAKKTPTLTSHQKPVKLVKKVPPTTSTPLVLPISSPFAPSHMSSKLRASPFVRSESPTEPDVESLL